MSPSKELQQLIDEFEAARATETAAIKMIDSVEASKDLDLIVKVTQEMLRSHNKSMEVYFKLLKHKLNPQQRTE